MTYQVIPQKDKRYSVEMISRTGKQTIIPDFRDQAEARAWIVQTMRLLHDVDPGDGEKNRKPGEL